MGRYSLTDFAEDILKESGAPLSCNAIWKTGKESKHAEKLNITSKTPWQTLSAMLFCDVKDSPNSRFIKIGGRPVRFFLKSRINDLTPSDRKQVHEIARVKPLKKSVSEEQLYALFPSFAFTDAELGRENPVYVKTVNGGSAKKPGLNNWLHPDMAGFSLGGGDAEKLNGDAEFEGIRLLSFEVKKKISKNNHRKEFFRAVAGGAWANEAYLITVDLLGGDSLIDDLGRLSERYGVGIILLDLEEFSASETLFPAKTGSHCDRELLEEMRAGNPVFNEFLEDAADDGKRGKVTPGKYDKVLKDVGKYLKGLVG